MNPTNTEEARRLETMVAQNQGQANPYQTQGGTFVPPPQPPAYTPPAWATGGQGSATPSEAYGLNDIETQRFNEAKTGATAPIQTVDQIFQDKQRMYQAEIDAVNRIFANKLSEANRAGMNRMGSAGARQARSGTAGSDFGAAEDKRVMDYNTETVDSINNEKMYKIQSILGNARKDAEAELIAKREARDNDYNKYVDILTTSASRKKEAASNTAKALLAGGATIEDLKSINFETQFPGLKSSDIISAFEEQSKLAKKNALDIEKEQLGIDKDKLGMEKTRADIAKGNTFELSQGQTRYVTDPVTGKTTVVAAAPKTYAPKSSSSNTTNTKPVIKSGSLNLSANEYNKLITGVNNLRGADGYLAPEVYKDLYQDWVVSKGGKEADFLKEFPPTRFVNPLVTDLPDFLQNKTGRKTTKTVTEDEA